MAGDFACRVDSVGLSRHDAVVRSEQRFWERLGRQGASQADRAGTGGAVRRGHGRQAGSQESAGRPGARRPAPGSGFRTSPDRRPRPETGSISPGSRRPPPTSSKGASHRETSSRMRAPDRAGTVRVPTGNRNSPDRNEAPTGAAGRFGSTDRRPSDPGARGGARISPRPRWPHRPPGVAAGGGPSKPREVDRVPIREAARGFVAPARRHGYGRCTLNRFAVAERLRGR